MSTNDQVHQASATDRRGGWKPWILVPAIVGAIIGGALAARVTPVYRSEAVVRVVPQPIASLGPSTTSGDVAYVAQTVWQSIVSRTRLERLIEEFGLYNEDRLKGADRREIIETMRKNVELSVAPIDAGDAVAFRVGFTGTEPAIVMRVTERLTALLMEEHRRHGELVAEGTHEFLSGRLTEIRSRLDEKASQLRASGQRQPDAEALAIELDVLQATFTDLCAKTEEARMAANLEGHGQLALVDPARVPERPIVPVWRHYLGGGAGAGLAAGVLMLLLGPARYRRGRGAGAEGFDESRSDTPSPSD
jgi:uncharacterized protein involved in exopolysaccharide biosynthesis